VKGANSLERMIILCDPQTSGGLLIACEKELIGQIKELAYEKGALVENIGFLHNSRNNPLISVE
jgi:selenophosphate synthase